LEIRLVRGNHDLHAGDPPADCGIVMVDEPYALGDLDLRHHPVSAAGRPAVAGHRHPGAMVVGRARDALRLPCFELHSRLLVLPAFGGFTGMHLVQPAPELRRFVTDGARVVELV
jgi:metallophosphoesterase superfamily enzyme